MKKQILTIIAIVIASLSFGQVDPSSTFNYKALITDNGNPLVNHPINIRFTINAGNDIYQETQNTTTDANGIVITTIGDGTVNFGDFENINWQGMHFLKVEIDTGNGYQIFSNEPLHRVPYASYADKANSVENVSFNQLTNVPAGLSDGDDVNDADHSTTNELQTISRSGSTITLSNGGGSVTLPDQHDADFYKVGSTTPPTNINDFIYTYGRVGIGTNNPSGQLEINGGEPRLILSSATNNSSIRPGIQFKNNTSQFIAGDDGSNEIFGFYSKWANHRTHDAKLRVYGKATGSGSWGKYVEITHDGTDATIKTDTGNILLEPNGNVGIGTNSPTSLLHISAGTTGDAVLTLEADTDNAGGEDDQPRIEMSQDGGLINAMIGFDDASNHLQIKTTHNFEFYNGDAGSQQKVASLDTGGNLNITGKITAPATGSNDLKAFAYGTIDLFGTILSGTGNFNVDINAGVGIKKITLRDDNNNVINYDNNHFTTLVSIQTHPDGQDLHDMVYYITNNTLVIKTFVRNGPPINVTINFIIYKN